MVCFERNKICINILFEKHYSCFQRGEILESVAFPVLTFHFQLYFAVNGSECVVFAVVGALRWKLWGLKSLTVTFNAKMNEDTARLHGWPWTSDALMLNSVLDTKICTKHNGRVWNHENGSWNIFWPVRICLERDLKGHTWHLDTAWLIISQRKQWLRNHP